MVLLRANLPRLKSSFLIKFSIMHYQSILLKLYTKATERAKFFANRNNYLEEKQCSVQDSELLLAVDKESIERYAQHLINKRIRVLKKIIPELFEQHLFDIESYYFNYASENALTNENKFLSDIFMFFDFLKKKNRISNNTAIRELLQHLKFRLLYSTKKAFFVIKRTSYYFEDLLYFNQDELVSGNFCYVYIRLGRISFHRVYKK